jgi:alpha-L-rhamnosidase
VELEHPEPFAARWRARWVWDRPPAIAFETMSKPVDADPTDHVALFRRVVVLEVVPASAPARIWVDGRHVLRVNGVEVARGPVRSEPRQAHYDVVDLAPHLVVGENVIAIVARRFGTPTSWWVPVPPSYSLGVGSLAFEAVIGDEWVVTDRSWRAVPGEAWTPVALPDGPAALPLECFDARNHPYGWDRPGFDDTAWGKAFEITPVHGGGGASVHPPSEPFGMLRPPVRGSFPGGDRHEASLLERRTIPVGAAGADPVRSVHDAEAGTVEGEPAEAERMLFDLGRTAAGTVSLRVTGAAPGTIVDVAASEHLDRTGRIAPLGQLAGFRYVCRGGESTEAFETLEVIGTRYLLAVVRTPEGSPAPELGLAVDDRLRPRPEGASFECSDPLLNRVHSVGLRTVDLCALDAYVDCPTREQRAWTGDSVVHQMVDLTSNPDWSMAIWHPQLAVAPRTDGMLAMAVASDFAAADQMFIPDWPLHWLHSVHNLYRYTGDRDLVAELLVPAERMMRWFESYLGDDGLLHDVSGWVLVDWASVYVSGCSSILNGLWARALEELTEMARWLGNEGTAVWADRRYEGVKGGFDVFWDEGRGSYVDHVVDGVARRPMSQHAGAAALAAGLVPADRVGRVLDRILDRSRLLRHSFVMYPSTPDGPDDGHMYVALGYPEPTWDVEEAVIEAEPFFRYLVHDAVARAGRPELIADLCRDWKVFLDAGHESWPECWTGGTNCHGWSSTPTRDLIVHTLGITPAEPGYASVRVVPNLGDLEWARATVPTPHGPVTVEAHADGRLVVDSPVPVVRR